ncbi:MAG: glycosyltransferase family 2 protein [Deltaproteobacteria bacterium]|nr:glycosyltransferase family 2 protein [Deltaproteobacteria bacterium]
MPVLVSVVSHQQADLVFLLLKDFQNHCLPNDLEVIVTVNSEEKIPFKTEDFDFKLLVVQNDHPRGFAANHNAAFKLRGSDFFCLLNPDIRLTQDPFSLLMDTASNGKTGLVAPLIRNDEKKIEDSARRLPTPFRLFRRFWKRWKGLSVDYPIGDTLIFPEWVAGIFMLFPSRAFAEMKGFNEKYFLYFEDVDLCSRLRMAGYQIILDPRVSVIHKARRDSHANWQYFKWHLFSGIRFFSSTVFWACYLKQLRQKDKKTLWT